MDEIRMILTEIKKKSVAIVKFGPVTDTSGFRPAEYFQVTIDPSKVSPSGEYIRFGLNQGDEITGWQRVAAIYIAEILAEWDDDDTPPTMHLGGSVTMYAVE